MTVVKNIYNIAVNTKNENLYLNMQIVSHEKNPRWKFRQKFWFNLS